MSNGFFSWRRLHTPAEWQEEKNGVGTSRGKRQIMLCNLIDTHIAVSRPEVVPATTLAENSMWPKPYEVIWVSSRVGISLTSHPNRFRNYLKTQKAPFQQKQLTLWQLKEVLTLAQSATSMIPVPFLKEAIGVALKIIQVCEVR